jgi:DnaJ-class molecular chaperone
VSHYDVLGVSPSADADALHEAYLRLARRHHPDRAGGDAGRMQAINEAWSVLGDPQRRARYDLVLSAATAPGRSAPAAGGQNHTGPRRGYEPDPAYDPYDDIDPDLDDAFYDVGYAGRYDDETRGYDPAHPGRAGARSGSSVRATVTLPRWLRLLPMGTFASSIAVFVVAVVFASEPLLALALMTFFLACLFFLAAPFMALLLSRRPPPTRRE